MSMELGEMRETLTKRLQAAEKELSAKASSADLRAVQLELEEQVLLTMALHTMAAHRGYSPWLLTVAAHHGSTHHGSTYCGSSYGRPSVRRCSASRRWWSASRGDPNPSPP